jgi:Excalibur calcium-binding domain
MSRRATATRRPGLPPNKAFRCEYVEIQIAVKARYGLWVTQAEHDAMARVLSSCGTGGTVVTPAVPTPAQTSLPIPLASPLATPTLAPVPTTAPSGGGYLPGDAYNCSDFRTYAEAKAYFDAVPGDPSHLDGDHDGIPCESLPGAP